MKARYVAAPALAMAMLLTTPSASFADATATPKPTPKPTPTSTPTRDFESAIDAFHAEMKAREQIRKKITQKFIAEVNEANRIMKIAMQSAKTVDAKSVALAQQKRSVVLAASARDAAITALGPEPLQPAKSLRLLNSVQPEETEAMKKTNSDKLRPTRKK